MSVTVFAVVSILVLSSGGILPALALAQFRLVTIPLTPLMGALLASLAVTAMTGIGGTLLQWYIGFSVTAAVLSAIALLRRTSLSTLRKADPEDGRAAASSAFLMTASACALGLSQLATPAVSDDGFAIWTMHPFWYEAGHAASVGALRNPALIFSHPQYPPLVGGSIALAWRVSGLQSVRSGVVLIALLNAFAILAASTGMMDLARAFVRASPTSTTQLARRCLLGLGLVLSVMLALTAFREAGRVAVNGHADLLWVAAAVGAATFGLLLPWSRNNVGIAMLLGVVAGMTKIEGTLTAAVIIVLIGFRGVLLARTGSSRKAYREPVLFAISSLALVSFWPAVVRILHSIPNAEWAGKRDGSDASRLVDTFRSAAPHLEVLAVAVPVALVGTLLLRRRRKMSGAGSDLWVWAAIIVAASGVSWAYVTGPGSIRLWLDTSIQRTSLFPLLGAWWIVAFWVLTAVLQATEVRSGHDAASAAISTPER